MAQSKRPSGRSEIEPFGRRGLFPIPHRVARERGRHYCPGQQAFGDPDQGETIRSPAYLHAPPRHVISQEERCLGVRLEALAGRLCRILYANC